MQNAAHREKKPKNNTQPGSLFQKEINFLKNIQPQFEATVVDVTSLTPTIVEIIVHAPLAARAFKPGQFFKLQNFARSPTSHEKPHRIMEPLALKGASSDPIKGSLSLVVLEIGQSSSLCRFLEKGEKVVLMGPTGTPSFIPSQKNVVLIGGGLGNAVLFSIGKEAKRQGSRVLYFAGYKKHEDLFKRHEIEEASDQVIWCTDQNPCIVPHRPQDRSLAANMVEALSLSATMKSYLIFPLNEADHLLVIGSDRLMQTVSIYCFTSNTFKRDLEGYASINSPMQCMMKEICAQCIQRHIDPTTGTISMVYSCVNQDQSLKTVDFSCLQTRLQQNSLTETVNRLVGL